MNQMPSVEVTIYKDNLGVYPEGCTRVLDCRNVVKAGPETITTSLQSTECAGGLAAGSRVINGTPEGTDTVDTIKVKEKNGGFMWLLPASWDALTTACNACCTS